MSNNKTIEIFATQGSKGGVGKTCALAHFLDCLKTKNIPFIALDLDTENKDKGGLESFFPEAKKTDTNNPNGLDVLLDVTEKSDTRLFVVDMPAATGDRFFSWFDELYGSFAEYQVKFTLLCMITSDPSTVTNTLLWANVLRGRVRYVIVKNPVDNVSPSLYWSDDIEQVHQFKKSFDHIEIELPYIRSDIAPHLVNYRLTLGSAVGVDPSLAPELSTIKTQHRIKGLRDLFFAAYAPLLSELQR